MRLYLLPGSSLNLDVSIKHSITYNQLEEHLSGSDVSRIREKMAGQSVHCWAFASESRVYFSNMKENDVVLFKENGDGDFFLKGRVAYKIIDDSLGAALWRSKDWRFIFLSRTLFTLISRYQKFVQLLDMTNILFCREGKM